MRAATTAGWTRPDRLRSLTLAWLDRYLRRDGSAVDTRFEVSQPDAFLPTANDVEHPAGAGPTARASPGVTAPGPAETVDVTLTGSSQIASAPAGGVPAAVTSLPGLGSALSGLAASGLTGAGAAAASAGAGLSALPGQVARFASAPLPHAVRITGTARVDSARDVVGARRHPVRRSCIDVAPEGGPALPESLVAPVYLPVCRRRAGTSR